MKKTVIAAGMMVFAAAAMAKDTAFVYVSNGDSGTVTAYTLDKAKHQLKPIGEYPTGLKSMPMVVSKDKKTLYISVRSQPYHVAGWHIQPDGSLTHFADTSLPEAMAYIALDKTGRFLLSSSYGGDLFSINRLAADGKVESAPVQVVHTGKRAHSIQTDPSNQYLFVPLLGADQLLQYRFDSATGKVTPNTPAFINIQHEAATGPRHFAFAPAVDAKGEQNMYLLTEMAGNISRLTLNQDGTMTERDVTPSLDPAIARNMQRGEARPLTGDDDLPKSEKPRLWQADIHLTPNGRFLYSTERTSSSLTAFNVSPTDGKLTLINSIKTETQPRGFAIDNSGHYLIESGQKSSQISLYAIDQQSGKLNLIERVPTGKGANWVTIVE
ncbi:beta-propeller fold lactonase family protein [Pantoea sp. EA-12]|uniref:lactonase family protein n=1 Tax=Pantoea sp. EA-12 TaxID=3043303 RepID=UPI0024B551FD|nr:beta-propeller fold lactonase family protein [Pantoea sp. EA-12]MDI9221563.1 beta-propeller fold lactonase family protein [Pantoea sp. EA-12]